MHKEKHGSLSLETQIGTLLRRHGLNLVTAESCTGGLLGHLITSVPGASNYYLGGVVSYADEIKVEILGVQPETIEQHGAVSKQTVIEMAKGIRTALGGDIGLGVTGIAGPRGGTPAKPAGLTWIGISTPDESRARRFVWDGDREANKLASARAALEILRDYLTGFESEDLRILELSTLCPLPEELVNSNSHFDEGCSKIRGLR